jgi:GTPase SAR1 family protein
MGNKHRTPTQTTIRSDCNVRKVLLLGTGASGKSTLCRSITTHYHPYNIPDYDFKGQIISTLTEAILRTSLTQYEEWNFLASQNTQALKANEIDPEIASAIKKLWSIEHVREQLRITQSLPNAIHDMKYLSYYISRLDELSKPHSKLTAEDYTRIRVKTTGIVELEVPLNKHHTLQLLDVGGNRNERKSKCT